MVFQRGCKDSGTWERGINAMEDIPGSQPPIQMSERMMMNKVSREIIDAEEYMELMTALQTMNINTIVKSIMSIEVLNSKLRLADPDGERVTATELSSSSARRLATNDHSQLDPEMVGTLTESGALDLSIKTMVEASQNSENIQKEFPEEQKKLPKVRSKISLVGNNEEFTAGSSYKSELLTLMQRMLDGSGFDQADRFSEMISFPSKGKKKCAICAKVVRADNFKIHMRNHTGEKPYRCPICPFRTANPSSLPKHLRLHESGKKMYHCHFCSYCTIFKSKISAHKFNYHAHHL